MSCSSTASDDLALQAFDESVRMYELILVSDPEHEMARDVINAVRDFPGEIGDAGDNARDVDG